jgi:hypothetical protein
VPDLHGWITQQIDATEEHALDHLVDPAAVLRRCAADRKILTIHKPAGDDWEPYGCTGCGIDSEYGFDVTHTNDCETLQALAEGYGLTEEQRAALDQPEPIRPERRDIPPPVHLDALVRLLSARPTSSVPAALRGPNWPGSSHS